MFSKGWLNYTVLFSISSHFSQKNTEKHRKTQFEKQKSGVQEFRSQKFRIRRE
jgi:hypothetical protein